LIPLPQATAGFASDGHPSHRNKREAYTPPTTGQAENYED